MAFSATPRALTSCFPTVTRRTRRASVSSHASCQSAARPVTTCHMPISLDGRCEGFGPALGAGVRSKLLEVTQVAQVHLSVLRCERLHRIHGAFGGFAVGGLDVHVMV